MEMSQEHAYLCLGSTLLMIECFLCGPFVMNRRKKYFTPEFLKGNFEIEPSKLGYPDMGNGLYSDKLSFKGWYEMNIAQRVHANFVEWIPIWLFVLWIISIELPWFSVVACALFVIFRGLYLYGYAKNPNLRAIGALPFFLVFFSSLGVAVYVLYRILTK